MSLYVVVTIDVFFIMKNFLLKMGGEIMKRTVSGHRYI